MNKLIPTPLAGFRILRGRAGDHWYGVAVPMSPNYYPAPVWQWISTREPPRWVMTGLRIPDVKVPLNTLLDYIAQNEGETASVECLEELSTQPPDTKPCGPYANWLDWRCTTTLCKNHGIDVPAVEVTIMPWPEDSLPGSDVSDTRWIEPMQHGGELTRTQWWCQHCHGTGWHKRPFVCEPCQQCRGSGLVPCDTTLQWVAYRDDSIESLRHFAQQYPYPLHVSVRLRLSEGGGGYTSSGESRIVCGIDGRRLLPSEVGHQSNQVHAVFHVPHNAILITYEQSGNKGDGYVMYVSLDANQPLHIGLVQKVLWHFNDQGVLKAYEHNLPYRFRWERMRDAVEAAKQKARVYHCRSACYTLLK